MTSFIHRFLWKNSLVASTRNRELCFEFKFGFLVNSFVSLRYFIRSLDVLIFRDSAVIIQDVLFRTRLQATFRWYIPLWSFAFEIPSINRTNQYPENLDYLIESINKLYFVTIRSEYKMELGSAECNKRLLTPRVRVVEPEAKLRHNIVQMPPAEMSSLEQIVTLQTSRGVTRRSQKPHKRNNQHIALQVKMTRGKWRFDPKLRPYIPSLKPTPVSAYEKQFNIFHLV